MIEKMKMFKEIFLLGLIVSLAVLCLSSCASKNPTPTDKEALKYMPIAEKYCAEHNLEIQNYTGKTIIRAKDYSSTSSSNEPAVYEWNVMNKTSKEKMFLWVGPILPMFPNMKPGVSLAKTRYNIGGKVEEAQQK